ncbi:hypothetical protein [Fusicatenibacter saccharivorans]
MKRCFGVIVLWMCIAISYIYWCSVGNETVVSSFVDLSDGYCIQEISVLSNNLFVWDQKEYAKKLVIKALNNQYENVLFSYDIAGYPNEMRIIVYDNRKNYKKGKKAFQINYSPCQIGKNVDASRIEILR